MDYGIEHLNPLTSLVSIAILFLIASVAGWYVGNLIQCYRSGGSRRPYHSDAASGARVSARCDSLLHTVLVRGIDLLAKRFGRRRILRSRDLKNLSLDFPKWTVGILVLLSAMFPRCDDH